MNLQDLLPELIFQICELLCQHCAEDHRKWPSHAVWPDEPESRILRRALLSLSLVCKSWGSIAQKVLHHHFGLLERGPASQVLFCRTISKNPDLAKQLKHAELRHIEKARNKAFALDWIPDVLDWFSGFLHIDVASCREEFVAPLILLQAPNLKHLVVGGKRDWILFERFNKQALVQQCGLPRHIKALSHGKGIPRDNMFWSPVNLSQNGFGGILPALGNLQQLAIGIPDRGTILDPLTIENIRTLCFGNVCLNSTQLYSLVSATGQLEDFAYRGHPFKLDAVSGQEVFAILALRKDTLKAAIVITHRPADQFTAGRKLTKLEILTIEYDTFWYPRPGSTHLDDQALVGAFPPSLEYMSLSIFHEHFEGMREAIINYILSASAESRKEQRLKVVLFDVYGKANDPQTPDEESLQGMMNFNLRILEKRCGKFLKNKGRIRMQTHLR